MLTYSNEWYHTTTYRYLAQKVALSSKKSVWLEKFEYKKICFSWAAVSSNISFLLFWNWYITNIFFCSLELFQLLKELRNNTRELFLCPPQKQVQHNQHFKLLFFLTYLHFGTSNFLSACRKTSLILIIGFTWSNLLQKPLEESYRPSILQMFLLCLKRNDSQTFKSSNCNKLFLKCVYYGYNLLQ